MVSADASAQPNMGRLTIRGTSASLSHTYFLEVQVYSPLPYRISVTPATLSLTPASIGTVQISTSASLGPSVSVNQISPYLYYCGVDFDYRDLGLSVDHPAKLPIRASAVAQPLQNVPIVVATTDSASNQTSVEIVLLSVTVPFPRIVTPTRSTIIRSGEKPAAAVYDAPRKLVFVTLRETNQVRVYSSTDGHMVATIPVQQPSGIDETPNGTEILVGGYSPYIAVIDPDLLQVTRLVPAPRLPPIPYITVDFLFPIQVVPLSTGNALILGQHGNSTETHIYFWNRTTDQMSALEVPTIYFASQIRRTSDGSTALILGTEGISFYDAAHDSFSAPVTQGWFRSLRPDGHQFASEIGQGAVGFFDPQGNLQGSVPLGLEVVGGVIYSLNGKRLYVVGSFTSQADTVAVIDTQNFTLLGLVSDLIQGGMPTIPLAIDETGMIFGGSLAGVVFLDVQSSGALRLPLPGQFKVVPSLVSQSALTAVQLSTSAGMDPAKNYSMFIGAPPASPDTLIATNISDPSSNVIQMLVPPSPRAGPANVTLVHSEGWSVVQPSAVSYGPSIVNISPNAGSAAGGTTFMVGGYGFVLSGAQVTVGGQAAKVSGGYLLSPPGTPGLADVTVTTPQGSTTVRGGYQYLDFVRVFPREGDLGDFVYDRQRQRLYITNVDHDRVEIFDLGSQTYLNPIAVGKLPTGIALTPDGQLLAVMNTVDNTVSIISPDQMKVLSTKLALTPSDQQPRCQGQGVEITPAVGHRMLVEVHCTYLLETSHLHLLDLDSGSLSCSDVAGCDASGQNISFRSGYVAMASSLDGSKILLADVSLGGGQVGLLDFNANTLTTGFLGVYNDATVSADGSWFAASFRGFDSSLLPVSIYSSVPNWEAGPGGPYTVFGERLSPSGSLLFMPKVSGVDIFDTRQGRLVFQVGLPDPLPYCLHALALDETGSKMFLISKSGITIAQLHKVPLSIVTVAPHTIAAGLTVTIRGSGFMNGAIVEFGGVQAVATFVDMNTLQAIVPWLEGDSTAVTVLNPDGEQYSLQAAFAYSALPPKSSVDLQINSGGAGSASTLNRFGSTRTGYAEVMVNSGDAPYGTAVFSFMQGGVVVSEVGVPASPPTTAARIFVEYRSNASAKSDGEQAGSMSVNTGFAAVNPGNAPARLSMRLRDSSGNTLAQGGISLPPRGHMAKFVDQLGPEFVLPPGFRANIGFGSLEVTSDEAVSILALRLTTNQRGNTLLTSTPIADLTRPMPTSMISFPQFVDGGGYQTALILLNTSTTAESGKIWIYDDEGTPLEIRLLGASSPAASVAYDIPAGGFLRIQTDGSSSGVKAGSVQVIPDSGTDTPVGAGVFGYTARGVLVTESGIPSATLSTHARVFVDKSNGHNTGLAIADTTGDSRLITVNAYQMDGRTPAGSGNFTLRSNGHSAKFAEQIVSNLVAGFTGVLDISSTSPFAALTLRSLNNVRDDFLLTTFPVADMTRPAPSPLIFPQIADGGGYQTQFILLSPTGAANTTLSFFADDGSPLAVGKSSREDR